MISLLLIRETTGTGIRTGVVMMMMRVMERVVGVVEDVRVVGSGDGNGADVGRG